MTDLAIARKILLLAAAAASLTALSACGEPRVTAPAFGPPAAASFAKTPTYPVVSLVVTVSNVDAAGVAYGIQDDGKGAYTDGSQSVQAVLDQVGTFAFNTNTGPRAATRWVSYSFNDPVDPANGYRPTPTTNNNFHFSTGASAFSQWTPIQNLGVNGNPSSECVYMGNGIANNTTSWRVSFHKGQEDTPDSPTAYAVVTRTSITPAVWTVTPAGSCSPASNVASLRSGDGSVLYGYYRIPFFFTLRAR